jgi:hypothetical protein
MRKILFIFIFIFFFNFFSPAQDLKSFKEQNINNNYKSFSFGMGVSYSDNPSLREYIEGDVPNYSTFSVDERLSAFSTGISFFGGAEFQLNRRYSVKGEYSYLIKSFNVPNAFYQYSYNNHQPMIIGYYLIPDDYSFIKFGIGAGYIITSFRRTLGSLSTDYSANGFALKGEGIINMQISGNLAGYIGAEIFKTFMSDLKNGDEFLLNINGSKVNTSSFGVGARLGIEFYLF